MSERLIPLNETVQGDLTVELTFSVTTLMRWMLTEQMTQSMAQQADMHGQDTVEEMRRMFAETSPWLLALTAFVSMLHTIFDVLAFKNDISCVPSRGPRAQRPLRSVARMPFIFCGAFAFATDSGRTTSQ